MKAILIPHDPQQQVAVIEVDNRFEAMAKVIGGGCQYIELVRCTLTPEYGLVMVLDEDGLGHRQHQNARAQWLYPFSPIVGNVLVCRDEGEDLGDLTSPDAALALVLNEVAG